MNKSELIDQIWRKTQIPKKDCAAVVDAIMESITEALGAGDGVQLVGFGAFEVKERKARIGRNPRTKEPVTIPASRIPTFRAGKQLKKAIDVEK